MTIVPSIGDAVQGVGAAIRFRGTLAALVRETAILTVAAHFRCDFEWFAHRAAGADAGLDGDQLEAIRTAAPADLPPDAAHARAVVQAILRRGRLDDADYARAVEAFGETGLAELVWLSGYYSMLAMALGTFDPAVPDVVQGQFDGSP
nr:carboxymuconolactone decarboxylase family protein [Microbacterium ulmi]